MARRTLRHWHRLAMTLQLPIDDSGIRPDHGGESDGDEVHRSRTEWDCGFPHVVAEGRVSAGRPRFGQGAHPAP